MVGRAFGARLAAQAGEAVGKRTLEAVAFARGDDAGGRLTPFDLPPPELPPGARERAEALAREIDRSPYGNGLGARLADIVLRQHGRRPRPSQTQGARGRSRRSAADGDRGLPCRREGGASHDEVGSALPQLPRCQDQRRRPLRVAARRALSLVQHRLRPRLREERGALLCTGTRSAVGARRRLLPLRPDGHPACRRAGATASGRTARRHRRSAAGLVSSAHAPSRRVRRRRLRVRAIPGSAHHGVGRGGAERHGSCRRGREAWRS